MLHHPPPPPWGSDEAQWACSVQSRAHYYSWWRNCDGLIYRRVIKYSASCSTQEVRFKIQILFTEIHKVRLKPQTNQSHAHVTVNPVSAGSLTVGSSCTDESLNTHTHTRVVNRKQWKWTCCSQAETPTDRYSVSQTLVLSGPAVCVPTTCCLPFYFFSFNQTPSLNPRR